MTQKKILIVDDDPEMRLALHIRLKANNYDVAVAVDGVSGIAETRKHMPDLILLDLGLPAGDGFTVLERLHLNDSLSHIPVIVVSGRDRVANKDRALKAGARLFLQKPVKNAELLYAIEQALGQQHRATSTVYNLGTGNLSNGTLGNGTLGNGDASNGPASSTN